MGGETSVQGHDGALADAAGADKRLDGTGDSAAFRATAITALGLTSTAAFADDGGRRFTHECSTYFYTSKPGHGPTVSSDRQLLSGQSFRLSSLPGA
jgi:hypothetical protein